MTFSVTKRIADTARRWLKEPLVEEVPDELARCEFGCRRLDCRMGEWESCEKRIEEAQDLRDWKARGQKSPQGLLGFLRPGSPRHADLFAALSSKPAIARPLARRRWTAPDADLPARPRHQLHGGGGPSEVTELTIRARQSSPAFVPDRSPDRRPERRPAASRVRRRVAVGGLPGSFGDGDDAGRASDYSSSESIFAARTAPSASTGR